MKNIKEKIIEKLEEAKIFYLPQLMERIADKILDLFSQQKQEIVEEIENLIRTELGMDCGYMGNEAWDWNLDNLPQFEDFISKLKQKLT